MTHPLIFLSISRTVVVGVVVSGVKQLPRVQFRHHTGPLTQELQPTESQVCDIFVFGICSGSLLVGGDDLGWKRKVCIYYICTVTLHLLPLLWREEGRN